MWAKTLRVFPTRLPLLTEVRWPKWSKWSKWPRGREARFQRGCRASRGDPGTSEEATWTPRKKTSRNRMHFLTLLIRSKFREHFEFILRTFHLIGTGTAVSKERNLGEIDLRAECFLFPAFPGTHDHITCNGTHPNISNISNIPNPLGVLRVSANWTVLFCTPKLVSCSRKDWTNMSSGKRLFFEWFHIVHL